MRYFEVFQVALIFVLKSLPKSDLVLRFASTIQFVDHFPSSLNFVYHKSSDECREKIDSALGVSAQVCPFESY